MRFMLLIYMNPAIWGKLTEEQQSDVLRGHDEFQKVITESGEMVSMKALAEPANTATVRVRDGHVHTAEGPHLEADEFFCGYYVVECSTKDRAIELGALIPDARYTSIEVRPFLNLDEG